jgi:hypothetical protein
MAAPDGEMSIWRVIEQFKSGWYWPVSGAALGLFGAIGFLIYAPGEYEVATIIQTATISLAAPLANGISMVNIEPLVASEHRLKSASFYSNDIVNVCRAASPKNLADDIKTMIVKGENIIRISYKTQSPAIGVACLEKIGGKFKEIQETATIPIFEMIRNERADLKQQIANQEREVVLLEKRLTINPNQIEPIILSLKIKEIIDLKQNYRQLSMLLVEPLNRPTILLAPVYTAESVMHRKRLMIIISMMVAGLFSGLLAMLLIRSWFDYRSMRARKM